MYVMCDGSICKWCLDPRRENEAGGDAYDASYVQTDAITLSQSLPCKYVL